MLGSGNALASGKPQIKCASKQQKLRNIHSWCYLMFISDEYFPGTICFVIAGITQIVVIEGLTGTMMSSINIRK